MRAPFVFGDDPVPLACLLQDGGFADVAVQALPGVVTFDSVQAFIRSQSAGSPLASHVNLHDEALLARMADVVAAALRAQTADEPIAFPIQAHIARGLGHRGPAAGGGSDGGQNRRCSSAGLISPTGLPSGSSTMA